MTDQLIAPHGGELVVNMADEMERAELLEWAFPVNVVGGQVGHKVSPGPKVRRSGLPQLVIEPSQLADLEMLAVGAYSPLTGFMKKKALLLYHSRIIEGASSGGALFIVRPRANNISIMSFVLTNSGTACGCQIILSFWWNRRKEAKHEANSSLTRGLRRCWPGIR